MAKKKKYYCVWVGKKTGVFSDWETCKEQIFGYPEAKYKSFPTEEEAKEAFLLGASKKHSADWQSPCLCVDAACSGVPGKMEYRGVIVSKTAEGDKLSHELFRSGIYEQSTNNIGEFLAIVEGLQILTEKEIDIPIYSDSQTAISWVSNKKASTKLEQNEQNKDSFIKIAQAEQWLQNNYISPDIMKWQTADWGEIPADFGRK